jgi:hypothetical protein
LVFLACYPIFLARGGSIAPVSLGIMSLDPSITRVFLMRDPYSEGEHFLAILARHNWSSVIDEQMMETNR